MMTGRKKKSDSGGELPGVGAESLSEKENTTRADKKTRPPRSERSKENSGEVKKKKKKKNKNKKK